MSRFRQPANKDATKPQPHEPGRDRPEPYAKEHEEYSGAGVVRPPEEKVGRGGKTNPPRKS